VERVRGWDVSDSDSNSELERVLATFVDQARARAKARDAKESELLDLHSSDFKDIEEDMTLGAIGAETGKRDSRVGGNEDEASASPALQLRPKRARPGASKVPGLRVGNSFNSCVAFE
jgi:hypothetical protein